jgi:diacylglycerol kinase (ATP)
MIDAVLLFNPDAGGPPARGRQLQVLTGLLDRYGIRSRVQLTSANRLPDNPLPDCDLVIARGGDGTIHQAVNWIAGCGVPLAVIPAGTANVLAIELGLPHETEAAVRVAAEGRRRRLYLGEAAGRYFHLMAGIGLDAHVIEHVRPVMKKHLGVAAFWMAGLASFWTYPLTSVDVEMNGECLRATFVVIANARNYGGHLQIAPSASPLAPGLDVCLFSSTDRTSYLRYLSGVLMNKHLTYPDVFYRRVERVTVRGDSSVMVQMDGEVVGHLPMEFSTSEASIEVLVPPVTGESGLC